MTNKDNEEMVKNNLLASMNNASSIEELLDLKWQFTKTFNTKYYNIKASAFYKNVDRLTYINALRNMSNIVNDLINNKNIEEIKDKYNTTLKSIKKMFNVYSKNGTYQDKILKVIKEINSLNVKEGINYDLDFICAKTAVQLFIDNDVYNGNDADKKTHVSTGDYSFYLNLLKGKKHPLYFEYHNISSEHKSMLYKVTYRKKQAQKKKDTLISRYTNIELISILSNSHSQEFINFTSYYNLNNIVFSSILKMNKNLIYEIANNRDNIWYIYNYYVDLYRQVAEEVIRDIKLLSKDKFKTPLDLYKYYSNNYNLLYIAKIAKELPDLKNNTLILKYVDKFSSLFEVINEKNLNTIKLRGHLFCLSENISFTNRDLKSAINDIEGKGMPLLKGVLYGSIKRQIDIKNSKVKKKTLC